MSDLEYATMSYLANFPGPLPNKDLAHGMLPEPEPIHYWVSAADAVASQHLSNYPNYRIGEGGPTGSLEDVTMDYLANFPSYEGYGEGYNEDYGAWTSSISQLPAHLSAAAGTQPPPIVPVTTKPPVKPVKPAKPVKPVKPGGAKVPWYASPLVWSLIALGAFLLVIIIIIIVTSVQNNKKSRAITFSWANSRW